MTIAEKLQKEINSKVNEVLGRNPLTYETQRISKGYRCVVSGCPCGQPHQGFGERMNHARRGALSAVKACIADSLFGEVAS